MSLKPNRGKSLKSLTLASISLHLNKTQVKPEVADCTGSIYLFDEQDVVHQRLFFETAINKHNPMYIQQITH